MSLLDRKVETVTVFPEIVRLDEDGNTHRYPSPDGFEYTAVIQSKGQSGTAARRSEQDNEGYESETILRLRFTRGFEAEHGTLGRTSEIEWNGERWTIFGDPYVYNGSPRTAHVDYVLKRG